VKESIEGKSQNIKNLKYSIHHATKAYNDAIRVYEAKLVQFGIPAEELGFQTLQTITSTMPAGLVSS
jgi:growth arrest-specific protein 8